MGKVKKTRKFATVRRMLNPSDERIKAKEEEKKQLSLKKELREKNKQTTTLDGELIRHAPKISSAMFLSYNTALGPPYQIICDTNFINFSLTNKLDIIKSMMDCLLAKCIPCVTDCVIAEFEKLGSKYRVALAMAKDPRFTRLKCDHKGTYADDCLVKKVMQHKCYIVATCDKDLKRRIRKIPGIPIMFIKSHRYSIERFPTVNNAPKNS